MPLFWFIHRARKGYFISAVNTLTFQEPPGYKVIFKADNGFKDSTTAGAYVNRTQAS